MAHAIRKPNDNSLVHEMKTTRRVAVPCFLPPGAAGEDARGTESPAAARSLPGGPLQAASRKVLLKSESFL